MTSRGRGSISNAVKESVRVHAFALFLFFFLIPIYIADLVSLGLFHKVHSQLHTYAFMLSRFNIRRASACLQKSWYLYYSFLLIYRLHSGLVSAVIGGFGLVMERD